MLTPELQLLLIRHGEAIANRDGAFLGRRNDPLTHKGIIQAQELAARLQDRPIEALYSSPLQRALITARHIAENRAFDPIPTQALMEQDFGDWDGQPISHILSENPDQFEAWRYGGPELSPPKGESLVSVADRVSDFYHHLRAQHQTGQTIALVGHASAFQALLCRLFGIPLRPLWPFKLAIASITEVVFFDNQPSLTKLST